MGTAGPCRLRVGVRDRTWHRTGHGTALTRAVCACRLGARRTGVAGCLAGLRRVCRGTRRTTAGCRRTCRSPPRPPGSGVGDRVQDRQPSQPCREHALCGARRDMAFWVTLSTGLARAGGQLVRRAWRLSATGGRSARRQRARRPGSAAVAQPVQSSPPPARPASLDPLPTDAGKGE